MLLTLLKVTFFFGIVLAAALGAVHLAENGHPLTLQFNGVEYTLGPVQAAVAAIVLVLGAWLLVQVLRLALAFLRFLAGDRTAIDRYFDRSRERKGYRALAEGMLAVASGEGRLAQDQAARAAKYLGQPHVTNVLAAQAAEVAGDAAGAERIYRDMLADGRTRFVGIRGLMQQRLALGDTATALQLAQKAYALKPAHGALQDTLLGLQTRAHDWKGARQTLKDKRRQGTLPQDVHLRRDAVLALQEASEVLAQGNSISAREAAISANRASPDLVPAAVLAARSYMAQKDPRNASRLLQKAWAAQPHPSLAAAYAEIVPDETPAQRLRRFEDLVRQRPEDAESRLLKAELALAAEDFPGARRALGDLAETHPTTRSLAIMAAVERGEGADDSIVRGWLARAMNASRGPQWVCDNCHNVMAEWAPVCDSCGGFDTLAWREPPVMRSMATAGNGVEMLPLIVGRPAMSEDHAEEAFAEGDAYAKRTHSPRHLPAPTAGQDRAGTARRAHEVPLVAPGMVPRESDYAPSVTITDPEPPRHRAHPAPARPAVSVTVTEVAPEPPHAPETAGAGAAPHEAAAPSPAGAAAEHPAAGSAPGAGAPSAHGSAAPREDSPGNPPVRPDVEPPTDEGRGTDLR
ncbi:heme biosynthesis protein HemY [Paracoccus contaminans]|uniref:Heme biosynthesis protein HemY n=1 Tax=Paracoccus contaminans TaxID=1945662 RepID=A0A1W6D0Q7_9RHOB|nr:heme biosynthesis HemY N-terminal domain-containing protein [Paracoccus contaminans]ARJ70678.1 heme biosynthesis protein HemY [Paracoccus contaminans]